MTRYFFIYVSIIIACNVYSQDVQALRKLYAASPKNEAACKELVSRASTFSKIPLYEGYYGSGYMMMANHYYNPYKKLKSFIEGKDILEHAIKLEPNSIELIFLRYSIQANAPSFLGYNKNLQSDKNKLKQSLPGMQDVDLKNRIQSYLNMQ